MFDGIFVVLQTLGPEQSGRYSLQHLTGNVNVCEANLALSQAMYSVLLHVMFNNIYKGL